MRMRRQPSTPVDANFRLPDLTQRFLDLLPRTASPKTDYLWGHLLSKFCSSDTAPSEVRRTRAINKWLATEQHNDATNDRLLGVDPGFNILPRVPYETFMRTVSRIVTDVIGEVPPDDCLNGSFSGGATTSRRRSLAHPSQKYVGEAHVTSRALNLAQAAIGQSASDLWVRLRGSDELTIVPGNVLFTVPKNAEIDRCACKEPDLNMYLQKGVGDFIRRRLRRFGIDLNDQSRNRSLARTGSVDGSLATIDLSSASDSISYELVAQCLPTLWFTLLCDLRSPITIIDGVEHVNSMFSSMGNGFTFELESLLFYAIARATAYHTGTPGILSVYGDDIIIPVSMAHDYIFVLSFLGFDTNVEKSFISGPIRESCGGHFINGYDITPFYIRKPIDSLIDCILVANQLRRWSQIGGLSILDCDVEAAWRLLASQVPLCFWGGHDLSDSHRLVSGFMPDNPKRLQPLRRVRGSGIGGYLYWHDLAQNRTTPGEVILSEFVVESTIHRSVKVRWCEPVTSGWFLSELATDIPPAIGRYSA